MVELPDGGVDVFEVEHGVNRDEQGPARDRTSTTRTTSSGLPNSVIWMARTWTPYETAPGTT